MSEHPITEPGSTATDAGAALGAGLRAAREAAGWSIDIVAQQLKLATRQVKALEDGQYELLPGPTFVRGFLRNYARLLRLDPDEVLARLPAPGGVSALPPASPGMGEIQFGARRRQWSRWAIPLALVAMVAIAALYEYLRPGSESNRTGEARVSPTAPQPGPPIATTAPPVAPVAPTDTAGKPLPNPLKGPTDAQMTTPDANGSTAAPVSGTKSTGSAAPAADSSPTPPPQAAPIVSTAIPPGAPGDPTLVVVFRGTSWIEVKDASGKVLLSLTGTPGMTQSVTANPPLDVIVGNAANVSMTFRGAPVDLQSLQRFNVARIKLP